MPARLPRGLQPALHLVRGDVPRAALVHAGTVRLHPDGRPRRRRRALLHRARRRPARPPSARTPSLGFFRTPSRPRGALEAPPEEPPLDEPGRVKAFFEQQFERFDVARASCYDAVQRDRLLAIVEAGFGGLPAFNDALKETMRALKAKGRYTLVKKNGAVSCAASP